MSTITREQLRERAREKVKSLEFSITQTAFADSRAELEEELELARIAQASLELERGMIRRFDLDMSDCDSCGQDCGADMVEDLDGEYVLWDEVLPHLYRYDEYTIPPAPTSVPDEVSWEDVPEEITEDDMALASAWAHGFNQCRAAMLQGADGKPDLTVWYGAMPETNGKTNWTAMLHRKGQHPWEGITIDCSEYPDRVRYEADRMRHLIGELADEPDILAYDAEAHSGYVYPDNSPVIPDGWVACSERMPENGGKSRELYLCWGTFFDGAEPDYIPAWFFIYPTNGWCEWQPMEDDCDPEQVTIIHWQPMPAAPQLEVKL